MTQTAGRPEVQEAAEEIFELTKMSWMARGQTPPRKGHVDLTESEFLALDCLAKAHPNPMNVGEIQRRIGVLPAQMSRVIRSLESKSGKPLVRCRINAADKRKIDVTLSEAGRKAHDEFRDARLASTMELVAQLDAADRADLMRIVQRFRTLVDRQLTSRKSPAPAADTDPA